MQKVTLERHQLWIYLSALLVGVWWGGSNPGRERGLEPLISIALGLLLYATFCQVPLMQLRRAFRHQRFMVALCVANFAIVPGLVWLLARGLLDDTKQQFGVFLVLLVPCTDWFLTFTYLGKGHLPLAIASTPVLLLLQSLLLPFYLWLFTDGQWVGTLDFTEAIDAFVRLILLPLGLALLTEQLSKVYSWVMQWLAIVAWLPIPLLGLVLLLLGVSQVSFNPYSSFLPLTRSWSVIFRAGWVAVSPSTFRPSEP